MAGGRAIERLFGQCASGAPLGETAAMVLAAWVPPPWHRSMDHRVVEHHDGDVRRADVHGPARARLLERHPLPASEAPRRGPAAPPRGDAAGAPG